MLTVPRWTVTVAGADFFTGWPARAYPPTTRAATTSTPRASQSRTGRLAGTSVHFMARQSAVPTWEKARNAPDSR